MELVELRSRELAAQLGVQTKEARVLEPLLVATNTCLEMDNRAQVQNLRRAISWSGETLPWNEKTLSFPNDRPIHSHLETLDEAMRVAEVVMTNEVV